MYIQTWFCPYTINSPLPALRIYTTAFAKNLLQAYEEWCAKPSSERGDLRTRRSVDGRSTDRELFGAMDSGDLWLDSQIHEVFLYLYGCKHCETLAMILILETQIVADRPVS